MYCYVLIYTDMYCRDASESAASDGSTNQPTQKHLPGRRSPDRIGTASGRNAWRVSRGPSPHRQEGSTLFCALNDFTTLLDNLNYYRRDSVTEVWVLAPQPPTAADAPS